MITEDTKCEWYIYDQRIEAIPANQRRRPDGVYCRTDSTFELYRLVYGTIHDASKHLDFTTER